MNYHCNVEVIIKLEMELFGSVAIIFLFIKDMDQYKLEYEKGSGTFSVVFTALSLKTGKYVAIKCMKKKFDSL